MSTTVWLVAVPSAIGAAAGFGGAGLLHRLRTLQCGIVLSAVGFGLQVLALRFAPLTVVQPLLVTGVLLYLLYARAFLHHAIDHLIVLGAVLALVGLSGFLLVARPTPGASGFKSSDALPLGIALVVVVGCCVLVSRWLRQELSALPFAVATAMCYGVTAALVCSLLLEPDLRHVLGQWPLYALVVAPAGFLLNQNAFQEGALGSVVVATINVGDPVVAILVGIIWLGESLAGGPVRSAAEVALLMLMAGGVFLLAMSAVRALDQMRDPVEPGRHPT